MWMIYQKTNLKNFFDILGLDLPSELQGEEYEERFEEAKQKAIEYFEQNPEQIGKV